MDGGMRARLGAGLGAGLGTVGATSFLGIYFCSGMSRAKYKTALREHFQRSEECNGSEQRRCT